MLRIIGGSLRGRTLSIPPASITRPTSDRGRESLFNILEHRFCLEDGTSPLKNAFVLDLFAGSGAFGLECLSRGASFCVFVENNKEALSSLNLNLKALNVLEKSNVLNMDALKFFDAPPSFEKRAFDFIFLDPPYTKGYVQKTLTHCFQKKYCSSQTLFIVELEATEELSTLEKIFIILDKRIYGRAQFLFGHVKL